MAEIDRLSAELAALQTENARGDRSATSINRRGGLISSVVSSDSPLMNMDRMKVGGVVYGPDGASYPSVTDAIRAGVYNFTYFPISTGVRQENRPLRGGQTVEAPVETGTRSSLPFGRT